MKAWIVYFSVYCVHFFSISGHSYLQFEYHMLGLVWLACNTFNLYLELTYFLSILPKALPLCTDTNSVCVSVRVCVNTLQSSAIRLRLSFPPQSHSVQGVCVCMCLCVKTSGNRQCKELVSLYLAYPPECMCICICALRLV